MITYCLTTQRSKRIIFFKADLEGIFDFFDVFGIEISISMGFAAVWKNAVSSHRKPIRKKINTGNPANRKENKTTTKPKQNKKSTQILSVSIGTLKQPLG